MIRVNFRRAAAAVALALLIGPAHAQYLRSSYFMEGTSARLSLNPALQPTRGYFNFPVIGSLNVSANSNVLGVHDIIDIVDDGHSIYSNDKLYNKLDLDNRMNVNLNTDILSFGWMRGKNFWSVNLGVRMDLGAGLNKGMFDFMRNVNGRGVDELLGQSATYDMDNQSVRMKAYGEIGLGYSRRLTEKLSVGARVKALLGLGRAELKLNQFNVDMDLPDQMSYGNEFTYDDWMGKGYSYHAEGTILTTMEGGGLSFDQDDMVEDFDFEAKDLGLSGLGFGVDLGASYDITDALTVSASVLDLGFLRWKDSATRIGSVNGGENVTIDASNYDKYIGGDFLSLERLNFKKDPKAEFKNKTKLSTTVLLAAEYAFFKDKLALGAMYSAHFVEPETLHDLTLSATYRPKNWFNIAASFSPVVAGGQSVGLAMKLGPLFLGTDYMYFGKNTKNVNGFIGLSFPMGKKRAN